LVVFALLAAVAVVPVYLSNREMNEAQDEAVASTEHAVHKLNEAARLNPFATAPLVVRAVVLQAEGRRAPALDAAREAVARSPQDWTTWAALARTEEAAHDRVAAKNALRRVKALNPRAKLAGTR
jgi:tetratricopeptide (TPR) repeat protein